MIATEILTEEHRIISRVLECLDYLAERAAGSGSLDEEAARTALEIVVEFADRTHHAKEENRLFEVLVENGFPSSGGPVGVMLAEHEEGRALVREMLSALEQAGAGDPRSAASRFAAAARAFVALLRAHIDKEDQILFPMASQRLSPESAEKLRRDFRSLEEQAGGARHQKYIAMARALCQDCGVAFVESSELQTIERELMGGSLQ